MANGPQYGNIAMDTSWIASLPQRYEANQARRRIKETLADLDPNDPESFRRAAWEAAKTGTVEGAAMAAKFGELYRAQEQLRLEREGMQLGERGLSESQRIQESWDNPAAPRAAAPTPLPGPTPVQQTAAREAVDRAQQGLSLPPQPEIPVRAPVVAPTVANPLGRPGGGIPSTPRMVGDEEAISSGLYEPPPVRTAQAAGLPPRVTPRPIPPRPQAVAPTQEAPTQAAQAAPQEAPVPNAPAPMRAPQERGFDPAVPSTHPRVRQINYEMGRLTRIMQSIPQRQQGAYKVRLDQLDNERKTIEDRIGKVWESNIRRSEDAYKKDVDLRADLVKEWRKKGEGAEDILPTARLLENTFVEALKNPETGITTGTGVYGKTVEELSRNALAINDLAQKLGIKAFTNEEIKGLTDPVALREQTRAQVRELARKVIGTLSVGVSNKDLGLVEGTVPNVDDTTPAGNLAIARTIIAMSERTTKLEQLASDYMERPDATYPGMQRTLREYRENNPLFVNKDGSLTEIGKKLNEAPKRGSKPAGNKEEQSWYGWAREKMSGPTTPRAAPVEGPQQSWWEQTFGKKRTIEDIRRWAPNLLPPEMR